MISVTELLKNNAALFVSCCALLLTCTQIWTAKTHNKLSVKPLLTTFTDFDIDPVDPSVMIYTARLLNTGLGPAIIKKFEFLLDNVPLQISDPRDLYPFLVKELGGNLVVPKSRTALLRKLSVLAKDKELIVAQVGVKNPTAAHREAVERFHLLIEYESAYGEPFTYDSRLHKPTSPQS